MKVSDIAARAAAAIVLGAILATAAAVEPQEGRDYTRVVPALPSSDAGKVVVTEFFSYACPHCFSFAPALKSWEAGLPDDVALERTAVSVGRQPWVLPAQLFYTLRSLGKAEALDAEVFDALHVTHASLANASQAADWAASHGVDRAAFAAAFDSFSVKSFAARGEQLARAARLPSVPTLVIDGKYLVAIADDGDFASQLAIVDALIAKARADKGLAAP
jgi:thiol:disulfide interchange protein DsbA